jgi:hypothetical protein
VISHRIPNLQPKATALIDDDSISVPKYLFEGVTDMVHGTTKDGVDVELKYRLFFGLNVECIAYVRDALPSFSSIKIVTEEVLAEARKRGKQGKENG